MKKNLLIACVFSLASALLTLQPITAAADTLPPPLQILPQQQPLATSGQTVADTPHDSALGTIQDDPPEATFAPRRPIIISAFQTTGGPQFIQLYNDASKSTAPIDMTGWRVVVNYSDASSCSIEIDGAIFAQSYALLMQQGGGMTDSNAELYNCPTNQNASASQLLVYDHDALVERVSVPHNESSVQQWQRRGTTEKYRSGIFDTDFVSTDGTPLQLASDPWYRTPPRPSIQILEVLVNPRDCLPGDVDRSCYDYVKLKNTGQTAIDLSAYRLRTGYENAASRSTNTIYPYGVLPIGATVRIDQNVDGSPVSISANDGTVWLEDAYGIASYDLFVKPYVDSAKTAHKGQSWAYSANDNIWKWAVPSPMSQENNFAIPTPASKTAQVDTYKPCAVGQYRSSETNRCRSSVTLTSSLKPCAPNQTRNPLTNRCRGVLGASTTLKPCTKGQERNAETNRCRKIQTKLANSDFAVEPIEQGAKSFVGWWALGGLAVLAAGYASWEWRDEMRRILMNATRYIRGR